MGSRAGNGEGSIIKVERKKGVGYRACVSVGTPAKRIYHTADTRKEAVEWRDRMRREAKAGRTVRAKPITVPQVMEAWLASEGVDFAGSTLENYRSSFNRHVHTKLKGVQAAALDKATVKAYVRAVGADAAKAGRGDGRATARTAFNNLRTAMAWAAGLTPPMLDANPMANMKFHYATKATNRKAIPLDDAVAILAASEGKPSQLVWKMLIATGARRGEILGLSVGDVDFRNGLINITKIATPESHGRKVERRVKSEERELELAPEILAELKPFASGRPRRDPLFPSPGARSECNRLAFDTLNRWWKRDLKAAGLEDTGYVVHQLRHTLSTYLLDEAVPLKVVSEILGHSSALTTMAFYAGATTSAKKAAVVTVSTLLSRLAATKIATEPTDDTLEESA